MIPLLRHLGAAMLVAVAFSSCSFVPAKLATVHRGAEYRLQPLGELLELALSDDPDASHALGHFVERWNEQGRGATGSLERPNGQAPWQVSFETCGPGSFDLSYFDEVRPADDFRVEKLTHHRRAGSGSPLVGIRENRHRQPLETYYPEEGITRPITAYAVRRSSSEVTIHLLCPLRHERSPVGGRDPLAADFSVPWAALLQRTGKLNRSGIVDVITRRQSRPPRLYLLEPYDPDKQPLIMIHGLLSTPLAWANLSNELWADDTIRSRYQIWHYLYNTSAPALYSSRQLRGQLRELRPMLDPSGKDPAMRRTTLITHSMGGIVGKALAVEPGDAFWRAAFRIPPDQLKLSATDRSALDEAFEWQADPSIRRIIFCNVPHRGSDFADNAIGRIGRWIAAPPGEFRAFYRRVSKDNPGAFTPAYEQLGKGGLDSVHALSPKQPTLHILDQLPFTYPVITHSLIGDRGKGGPLEESSDGVVPYSSSHHPRAVSEQIYPTGHGSFDDPKAVEEIKRILRLADGQAR